MMSNTGFVGPSKLANREFTLQAIEGLLYGVAGNEHAPRLHQRDATLRRPLLRALWLSSDVADLAIADLKSGALNKDRPPDEETGDAIYQLPDNREGTLTESIWLALALLESISDISEKEELLTYLKEAMECHPERWQKQGGRFIDRTERLTSSGVRYEVAHKSLLEIQTDLVGVLCEQDKPAHAFTSVALPMVTKLRGDLQEGTALLTEARSKEAWSRVRFGLDALGSITNALKGNDNERAAYERGLREAIGMVLDCKQYLDLSTEGRYGLEDILEVYEARLAELLRVSGRADEAEVLQRQLVDKLAAKVEEARQKVEAKRVQLTTFGLRWRKLPAEPEEGRLLTNELLSNLIPPGHPGDWCVSLVY